MALAIGSSLAGTVTNTGEGGMLPEERELADKLIATTPAYLLGCDVSEDAVRLSFEALTGLSFLEYKSYD